MNWRALLAIAQRAGWKRAAWKAVRAIEEVREATDPAIIVQLLSDIRDAFDRLSTDRVTSKTLLAELARDTKSRARELFVASEPPLEPDSCSNRAFVTASGAALRWRRTRPDGANVLIEWSSGGG